MTFRPATILMLIAGATLTFSTPTLAAKPKAPRPVLLLGCPSTGVPAVCTEMSRGGTVYNVSLAVPAAPIGTFIILSGTPSQAHSFCRGTVLQNIGWQRLLKPCPKPKM
ncbi:MAG TPA: hypothetical protein VGO01_03930 [Bradyrhizobium sp.]|jgi:predicted deacylase|nr:hypothetical protein [Bradyrhizobium sp.]